MLQDVLLNRLVRPWSPSSDTAWSASMQGPGQSVGDGPRLPNGWVILATSSDVVFPSAATGVGHCCPAPRTKVDMTDTTSAMQSLWLATAPATGYLPLTDAIETDVAVIGGGIAGLTTALLLKRSGLRVVVLEAERVGAGVTGCTTAKVSALQATVYSTIRRRHGERTAACYAEASAAGVEEIGRIVADEGIDCDLQRRAAYTYALSSSQRSSVDKEFDAASAAGLPVDLVDGADLPFETFGAVRLNDQLQLHPVRLAQGMAERIHGDGSAVYEQSRVVHVSRVGPAEVHTQLGAVRAEHVVVATHFPILDRGLYFARLKPQRSYCIAASLRTGSAPAGMSISAGSPTRSIRGDGSTLIVGGEGHTVGSTEANPDRFARLEEFAREHWDVREVTHRWSAQDPSHYDHLPVVGPYHPGSHHLWVVSGLMKWGFSTSGFAAMLLTDLVNGRRNEWAATFTPTRVSARSLHETAELGAKFTADLVGDRLRPPRKRRASDVQPGEGCIVGRPHERSAVYRDDAGELHAVSARCPHMGCLLRFNSAERSWDCPCHGSRFDVDGAVLEGPAVDGLERQPAAE